MILAQLVFIAFADVHTIIAIKEIFVLACGTHLQAMLWAQFCSAVWVRTRHDEAIVLGVYAAHYAEVVLASRLVARKLLAVFTEWTIFACAAIKWCIRTLGTQMALAFHAREATLGEFLVVLLPAVVTNVQLITWSSASTRIAGVDLLGKFSNFLRKPTEDLLQLFCKSVIRFRAGSLGSFRRFCGRKSSQNVFKARKL